MKGLVDKKLDEYLLENTGYSKKITDAIRYSVLGRGKRIRPILVVESAKVSAGSILSKNSRIMRGAMAVGCAIEFIHAYSLIHDDLPAMDDDDYRRGKPTCHKAFGEACAILAGDALLPLAFGIISKELEPKTAVRVIGELSVAIGVKGMVAGQMMDLEYKDKNKKGNMAVIINSLKTSKLFEVSARSGAIIALAGEKKIDAITGFARYFGDSYQTVDDMLDKDEYSGAFDMDKAQDNSAELIRKAKMSLKIFGKKADTLKEITDYIASRTK